MKGRLKTTLATVMITGTVILGLVTAGCGGEEPTATLLPPPTPVDYTPPPTATSIPQIVLLPTEMSSTPTTELPPPTRIQELPPPVTIPPRIEPTVTPTLAPEITPSPTPAKPTEEETKKATRLLSACLDTMEPIRKLAIYEIQEMLAREPELVERDSTITEMLLDLAEGKTVGDGLIILYLKNHAPEWNHREDPQHSWIWACQEQQEQDLISEGATPEECDSLLKQMIEQDTEVISSQLINKLVGKVRLRTGGCPIERWNPVTPEKVLVAPSKRLKYTWEHIDNCYLDEEPELYQSDSPPMSYRTIGGEKLPEALYWHTLNGEIKTGGDIEGNAIIFFDEEKRPGDGALCWLYVKETGIWSGSER